MDTVSRRKTHTSKTFPTLLGRENYNQHCKNVLRRSGANDRVHDIMDFFDAHIGKCWKWSSGRSNHCRTLDAVHPDACVGIVECSGHIGRAKPWRWASRSGRVVGLENRCLQHDLPKYCFGGLFYFQRHTCRLFYQRCKGDCNRRRMD